jgi:hypothetical protein
MLTRPTRALLAVLVLLMPATLGAVAISAPAAAAPTTWTVLVGSQTDNMAIQGQRFLPGDNTPAAGDTVFM